MCHKMVQIQQSPFNFQKNRLPTPKNTSHLPLTRQMSDIFNLDRYSKYFSYPVKMCGNFITYISELLTISLSRFAFEGIFPLYLIIYLISLISHTIAQIQQPSLLNFQKTSLQRPENPTHPQSTRLISAIITNLIRYLRNFSCSFEMCCIFSTARPALLKITLLGFVFEGIVLIYLLVCLINLISLTRAQISLNFQNTGLQTPKNQTHPQSTIRNPALFNLIRYSSNFSCSLKKVQRLGMLFHNHPT